MQNDELLSCPNPWCNSRKTVDCEIRAAEAPILMPSRSSTEWAAACPVCPIQTPYFDTEAEAIAAWNTRIESTRTAHSGEEKCTVCGIANQGHHVHTAPFTENYHQFSGEGRSNGAGEDGPMLRDFADSILEAAASVCADPDGSPDDETSVKFTGEQGARIADAIHRLAALSAPQGEVERENCPDDIRALGWVVAVHNDYCLNGEQHTFWLFTKDGRAVKGEGASDAVALRIVRAAIAHKDVNANIGGTDA